MTHNNERDELADALADSIFRYTGVTTSSSKSMADELLAGGYRKMAPKWAETLTNDGTHEFTVSSDCDGSNVTYWRRTPGKFCIEDAGPWEPYEPTVGSL